MWFGIVINARPVSLRMMYGKMLMIFVFLMEDSLKLFFYYLPFSCNPDPDRSDFYNGPMEGVDVVREDWR